MIKRFKFPAILAAVLGGIFLVSTLNVLAEESDNEARKEKILANLKLEFEQLRDMELTISKLEPSTIPGIDEGILMSGGRQQIFLVSPDDKKLYFVAGPPIDVSRSGEEIAAEMKKIEEEKVREAADRRRELDESIAGRAMRGNPEAPVTIVEFSDFQCPYCARAFATVEEVLEKHPEDVKFTYLHFPLDFHPWAKPSAIAAACAAEQDQDAFWKLHDAYFSNQGEFNQENVLTKTKEIIADTGLDMEKWSSCAEDTSSEAYKAAAARVDADMAFGKKLGVTGTPGFFINGRFLNGSQPLEVFESTISEAKGDS